MQVNELKIRWVDYEKLSAKVKCHRRMQSCTGNRKEPALLTLPEKQVPFLLKMVLCCI